MSRATIRNHLLAIIDISQLAATKSKHWDNSDPDAWINATHHRGVYTVEIGRPAAIGDLADALAQQGYISTVITGERNFILITPDDRPTTYEIGR